MDQLRGVTGSAIRRSLSAVPVHDYAAKIANGPATGKCPTRGSTDIREIVVLRGAARGAELAPKAAAIGTIGYGVVLVKRICARDLIARSDVLGGAGRPKRYAVNIVIFYDRILQ